MILFPFIFSDLKTCAALISFNQEIAENMLTLFKKHVLFKLVCSYTQIG